MPRPTKPLNPYASWPALFGSTVQQLRLRLRSRPVVTQAELGKQIGFSDSMVSAVERGMMRPDAQFVEGCERELPSGGMLQAMLPFVNEVWDEWDRSGRPNSPSQTLAPAEVLPAPLEPGDGRVLDVDADSIAEGLELIQQIEGSDIGSGTLESIDRAVDRFCRDYPTVVPGLLIPKVVQRLRQVRKLLAGKTTLAQHRRLLVAGGWLTLLLACLQNDLGDREAAEVSRDAALRFGKEAEHQEIMAWSFELLAWFALDDGRLRDLVDHARAGLAISSSSWAGVQLAVQEARGWARIGERRQADAALRHGAAVLSTLPEPSHPEHHFVFDAPKLSFYAATCYAWLGQPDQAEEHAAEVVGPADDQSSPDRWPMRYAETSVDLGLVAVQRDDLERASDLGSRALEIKRTSASGLGRFAELDAALMKRAKDAPTVQQFHEQYALARREVESRARTT